MFDYKFEKRRHDSVETPLVQNNIVVVLPVRNIILLYAEVFLYFYGLKRIMKMIELCR